MDKNIKFEDIKVKKLNLKSIEAKIGGFTESLKATKDPKEALKVIRSLERYMEKIETQITVISIRYSLNTTDKTIAKLQDKVDEMMPLVSNLINEWNKILVKVPYRAELEKKLSSYYFVNFYSL